MLEEFIFEYSIFNCEIIPYYEIINYYFSFSLFSCFDYNNIIINCLVFLILFNDCKIHFQVRTWICRRRFTEMRSAAVIVQTYFRRFIAQKRLKQLKMIAQYENWAANAIQKHWRAYQTRKWFTNLRKSIVKFQSACRGYLFRTNEMNKVIDKCAKARAEEQAKQQQQSMPIQQQPSSTANNNKMNNVSIMIRTTPPNNIPKGKKNFKICFELI